LPKEKGDPSPDRKGGYGVTLPRGALDRPKAMQGRGDGIIRVATG
jgi:hypothetical protein